MSKRSIKEVSNPVENTNNKKMKVENTRPATQEEVDLLMTSLRKSADEAKNMKSNDLVVFQQEIDEMINNFRDTIQTLNDAHFTRQDFFKYKAIYLFSTRDLIQFLDNYLQDNKYLPREFYLKNISKIIQEILYASQTALGKLTAELHPNWKNTIQNKIIEMSTPSLAKNTENIKEVKELRWYAQKLAREVEI